jgi:hypothetical protein
MKITTIILYLFTINIVLFAQNDKPLKFSELYVSANINGLESSETKDTYGFGIGATASFVNHRKLNLHLGLEYNNTRQLQKSVYGGHFASYRDITYTTHFVSFPLFFRYTFGNKIKAFAEAGGFADLVAKSTLNGTLLYLETTEGGQYYYTDKPIEQKSGFQSTAGVSFGMGTRIPVAGMEIFIRPEYKFGINPLISSMETLYNRHFRLSIGVHFN